MTISWSISLRMVSQYLSKLPHDGDTPAYSIMPYDKSLHAPAPVVSKREPVDMAPKSLEGDVPTVDTVLLLVVDRVVRHLRVEPDDDVPDGLLLLLSIIYHYNFKSDSHPQVIYYY